MTAASENLLATYLAIGRTLPGAEVREAEGYVALLSDLPHPSGNFAARLDLDPWSAASLRELARTRPAFQAIALPDDRPEHLAELLQRAGFAATQRLASMVAEPTFGLVGLDMVPVVEETARRKTARFMADAFLAREPVLVREAMATATAAAPVSIYAHHARDRLAAAVVLSRTPGTLGIYNLCVAGPSRGRGMGSALAAWCLAQAAAEGRAACLQCGLTLEPWYAGHGFARTGAITVWTP